MDHHDAFGPPFWTELDGSSIRMETWEVPPRGFVGHLAVIGAGTPGAGFRLLCETETGRVTAVRVQNPHGDPSVSLLVGTDDVDLGFQDGKVVARLIADRCARITQRFDDGTENILDAPVLTRSA